MRHNRVIIACSSPFFAQDIESKIRIRDSLRISISRNDKELRLEIENEKTALVLIEDSFYKGITAYVIGTLRDKYPDVRFAVFTFREMEPGEPADFFTAAASSFINFRLGPEECEKGINRVVSGNDYMPEYILKELESKRMLPLPKTTLTKREKAVMFLLAEGRRPVYIANALGIKQGTVRIHKNHIYEKCGVHSQLDLVKFVDALKKYGGNEKAAGDKAG